MLYSKIPCLARSLLSMAETNAFNMAVLLYVADALSRRCLSAAIEEIRDGAT
ncbi:MAG: hypothetical protein ACREDL_15435 [Bradyrhizobium sp.]